MLRRSFRLLALLSILSSGACTAPREQPMVRAAKLGWGRTFAVEEATLRVRAVPAAMTPTTPERRIGKPGWGRSLR